MDDAEAPPAGRAGMVERLTQILDVFLLGPDHLLLEDVAAASGLPRSTTYRLLAQLVEMSWLEHGASGFRLGERARRLGRRVEGSLPLRAAAAEALQELQETTSAVVHLAVLEGGSVEVVDKVGGRASGPLHEQLHAIRRRHGLAITSEDMPWELRGVGAAIVGPGGPIGAISVGLPGRTAPVERFVPMLARAVRRTSQRLHGVRLDAERFPKRS